MTTKAQTLAGEGLTTTVSITINGIPRVLEVDNRTTLLDLLREDLQMFGTKKGCDHGHCGACTVLADGLRVNSCLALAVMLDGAAITTIEGIGSPDALHPMQRAFIHHDGFQCGFCTPGQIISAIAIAEEIRRSLPSHATRDLTAMAPFEEAEIVERMSGNLCRCGAYRNILRAILDVEGQQP